MSLTPFEEAREVYAKEPSAHSFEDDLLWHLQNGYVISRPDLFIMGRHVDSKAPSGQIVGRWLFHPDRCDAWHIALFAGEIGPAFSLMPWKLPLLAFERKNELRFVPLESIQRLSASGIHATQETQT